MATLRLKHMSGIQNLSFPKPELIIFSFCHPAGLSSSQPVIQEATFRTQSHPKRTRGSHPGPKNTQESQSIWRRAKLVLNQVCWDLISHAVTELSSKPELNWSSEQIHNPCFLWPALPLASLGRIAFLPSELYLLPLPCTFCFRSTQVPTLSSMSVAPPSPEIRSLLSHLCSLGFLMWQPNCYKTEFSKLFL